MQIDIKEEINKAFALHQTGNFTAAESLYKTILVQTPDNANVLNLLGMLKIQTKQIEEAILYLKKAVELSPCAYTLNNLGRAYYENSNYIAAINNYKKALEFDNSDFDTWFNLGLAYRKNNQFNESIEAYKKTIEIKSGNADVYFNLGNVYEAKNDTLSAIEAYEEAYKYAPQDKNNEIKYFLALSYFKIKDFKKGLKHYECRMSKGLATLTQSKIYPEVLSKPYWMGEDIKDKTLFVYFESGLGDTLMYLRYLKLLKDKCQKVLFAPQADFINLVRENDFNVEIVECMDSIKFDTHISLMSIPTALNLIGGPPFSSGYLKANSQKAQEYKEKYFNTDKLKIGIKWMGNAAYSLERVITIESFYKLFDIANTQFYSLQKGEGSEEFEKIPDKYNVIDLGKTFNNFNDTAAAIENLDLVICNDTSVAHLAGAMGKPCWILLPYVQNWRWHKDLSYSPWYDSVRLFKQNEPDNWDEVFDRVLKELKYEL